MSMKTLFITDLKNGDKFMDEPFLLRDVISRTTKDGQPFLRLVLSDKTGQVNGVYWDVPAQVQRWVSAGQVALVEGRVSTYRNAPQVVVTDLSAHANPDMRDFLRTSGRSREEMIAELHEEIESLNAPWQELLRHILLDEAFLPRFADAPAARRMHHAYMGGLLAHTLSMVRLAHALAAHYPYVNRDLLVSGVLLHDMGKVFEYGTDAGISVSDDGHLVGHIVRGVIIVEKAAAELDDFPADALQQLVHLIASHHGQMEWGAPVTPKTLEAILLHQIDLLDSRVQGFLDFLSEDAGNDTWSQKPSPMFGSYLQRPPNFAPNEA
ncbi:MAG: HD domain-containing protein [Anaerolineales bacterium]|nr:HD domain-containing protein [Anaerolineales bacterium]MCB8950412.1 HD domain-containing protein [Ardenticatenales bacterium]